MYQTNQQHDGVRVYRVGRAWWVSEWISGYCVTGEMGIPDKSTAAEAVAEAAIQFPAPPRVERVGDVDESGRAR